MALTFPLSASIGQTYQSGSSNTYEWTGTYWKIKNITTQNFVGRPEYNIFSASVATTGSNVFKGRQVVSGSILVSGSLVPATGQGTFTSSFTLGTPTNAWKDLYISQGSIIFVDAQTQATTSFTIENNAGGTNTVKYTAAITASRYLGDGSRLTNLPSTTNWNKDKEYVLRNTEQLTFSGDYILENCDLYIDGYTPNSIGEWDIRLGLHNGSITKITDNTYTIEGPNSTGNASDGNLITKYFDTATTMSIGYVWNSRDAGNEWPTYDVTTGIGNYPYEIGTPNMLVNPNSNGEFGTWVINIPADSYLTIGVWSNNSDDLTSTLEVTLPYTIFGDEIQYSTNKYFKKEGKIFIGGNLLVKDSYIENNGQINVGGEVILIGNSRIEGTGTII